MNFEQHYQKDSFNFPSCWSSLEFKVVSFCKKNQPSSFQIEESKWFLIHMIRTF
ncbi:hypothetical protein RchiOBHm_Chr3g0496571 [Rosa chinensis]|uniref:Uncharacterized protein n=1 Tax=Rosa chinensis TaxID=74649 RepID=A0A2P6RHI0_ROSCH|nr:hypothetical protein RchiOBHm_Chr3g0496571 [Rosa chinensis]